MEMVVDVLKKLRENIPVTWDRYTKTDDGYYVVYGWIPRSDSNRDFVMIGMNETDPPEDVFYTTSSAKYSVSICDILQGSSEDHNPCRKVDELFSAIAGMDKQLDA